MTIATLLLALLALPSSTAAPGEPVMLDFTATWCGPCRQMRPVVEQLIQKGYRVKPVDLDQNRDLAERYEVTEVPTFIVIDPESGRSLARTSGSQPAAQLASLYKQAKAKLKRPAPDTPADESERAAAGADEPDDPDRAGDSDDPPSKSAPASPNPNPWETVVRIKVHGNGSIGFGSGTLIASTPKESLILTCAHIFHIDGRRQPPPARFPLRITIDLFDGVLAGPKRSQVHYTNETFEGEAVDYDFARDVGLIRIRPGRRLPYARVVPAHWHPKNNMEMITVGCSEGHDATAWRTLIVNTSMKGLNGNGAYEAVECMIAPKQGRSGGGLFTSDGYIAGVCDFAEPRGNVGLYAAPRSICALLDRNNLMALYGPVQARPGTILAKNRATPGRITRAQSPEREESGSVSLPPPEMLGIKPPAVAVAAAEIESPAASPRKQIWHATPAARATDLKLDPSTDTDHFDRGEPEKGQPEPDPAPAAKPAPTAPRSVASKWRAGHAPLPELSSAKAN
jgi:thiol-disulfide isomerase/thioredoxin